MPKRRTFPKKIFVAHSQDEEDYYVADTDLACLGCDVDKKLPIGIYELTGKATIKHVITAEE